MKFDLQQYLVVHGPSCSSVIKKNLMERGLSDEAARQRISRTSPEVMRYWHFPLPKREAFLYLAKDFNSRDFWKRLLAAHTESRTVYAHTFHALKAYRGAVPSYLLARVSGSPVNLSKHVPVATLEAQMVSGGLLLREHDEVLGSCLVYNYHLHEGDIQTSDVRNQLLIEDILIKGVSDWLRKNGLASFNKIRTRNPEEMPVFCNHHWDITAPSYLRPLAVAQAGETANGFVVADIIFGRVTEMGIQGFISKVNRCRNIRKTRPFLAILVADSFDTEAQRLAKSTGVMLTTVSNFLGTDIARLMNNLLNTLNHAAAVAAAEPEKINRLFKELERIEGAAINVRGAMFEMLAGHMVLNTQNVNYIDLGKKVSHDGKKAEIDVIGFRGNADIKCYECKGYEVRRLVDGPVIERWLEQIQVIRRYFQNISEYRDRKLTFAYWTASDFTPEATELLESFRQRNTRLTVEWKNGDQIIETARNNAMSSVVKVLNEHYARHPLAKI